MSRTAFGSPSNRALRSLADPGGIAIRPGRLDQRSTRAPIAGQGEALPSDPIAGRAFRRDKSEEGHQLSWRIEPTHVADFGGEGRGDEKRGATHCLIGFYDRRHRPVRHDKSDLLLEPARALKRIFDRVDPFLKDDLLRAMFELLASQPAPMRQSPMATSGVNSAVTQQEGKQLLAFAAKIVARRLAGSHKIAHRLMSRVGGPELPSVRRPDAAAPA